MGRLLQGLGALLGLLEGLPRALGGFGPALQLLCGLEQLLGLRKPFALPVLQGEKLRELPLKVRDGLGKTLCVPGPLLAQKGVPHILGLPGGALKLPLPLPEALPKPLPDLG